MAKRSNQKLKLLYLYKILQSSTDESRGLTLSELSDELYKYAVSAERKTLYDDLEALRLFGLDVRVKRDRRVRYYVGDRDISTGALKLIADAVNSSAILSDKEAKAVLQALGEQNGRAGLLLTHADNDSETRRESLLSSVDLFCRAILGNKRMRGRYFSWNSKKQRIMQFEGRVLEFSPWYIDLSDDAPTVILTMRASDTPIALRIDRFVDLALTDASRAGEEHFARPKTEGGLDTLLGRRAPLMLRMRADNSYADEVIHRFGVGITVTNNREDSFEFSVKAPLDEKLYSWIFASRGRVELISPQSALEEYGEMLALALGGGE